MKTAMPLQTLPFSHIRSRGFGGAHLHKKVAFCTKSRIIPPKKNQEYKSEVEKIRNQLRKNAKYNILCDSKRMNQRTPDGTFIPQIISLPQLPDWILPKGFEHAWSREAFLLSEERYKLYEELDMFVKQKTLINGTAGFVPSGPHGIGKSGIGYLLACYAFLNGHILVYMPQCSLWCAGNESYMASMLMNNIVSLNADKLAAMPANYSKGTLLDLILESTDETAVKDMDKLLQVLRLQETHAVLFIFDEHNELYKKADGGNSPLHNYPSFLNTFTIWGSKTNGRRTVTIYIGSAHSRFEKNLPGGEEHRLRFLQPMTQSEIELLIANPKSQLHLPDHFFKDKDGNIDQNKMHTLKFYTGFLPGEVQYLKATNSFEDFEAQRTPVFKSRAEKVYESCTDIEKIEFKKFLISVLTPRYGGHAKTMCGNVYDKGLFYRSRSGFECISGPARIALTPLLSMALQEDLPPIDSIRDPGERGIVHEQWNIARFVGGQLITIQTFYAGTPKWKNIKPSLLSFKVDEIVYYEKWTENIEANLEGRRRLYIPVDKSHPAWDCIYDDGSTTIFFSLSISPYSTGHDIAVEESFQSIKGKPSQNSQIFSKLRGGGQFTLKLMQGQLVMKDPQGKDMKDIHFVYGCGLPKKKILQFAGEKRKKPSYEFMKFFGKEEMEKYGVIFK